MSATKTKISIEKLSALSREEKLALYDTIQKKKHLEKKKRDIFKPHAGQLPVLECKKPIIVVTAGNGYGKTALACNRALAAIKGYNPWKKENTKAPCTGVVVLDNPIKVKEVWLKELSKWHNMENVEQIKNGKPYVNELIFQNGSRIIFMFHDQEELVFESIEIDFAIYDEPPPKHVFIGLSRGQRTKGSKPWQLLIGTPISAAWIRTDLYEPWRKGENEDLEFFRGTTDMNKDNLAEGYIDSFTRLLTKEEQQIRLQGQFFDLGSLALAHLFKDDIHIKEDFKVPQDWPCIVAIDPHPSKKHVAIALTIDLRTGYKYVVRELESKSLARDFAMHLIEMTRGLRVVDWVSDSLGNADMTGGEGFKSFIQILNDCGLRVRGTTFEEKDDGDWIERIREALAIPLESNNFGEHTPSLRIFASCHKTVKDIKNVSWIKRKNTNENRDKLDISNKDFLACLKYALAAAGTVRPKGQEAKSIRLGSKSNNNVSIRQRYMGGNKR